MSSMAIKKLIDRKMEKLKVEYPTVPQHALPKPKYTDKNSNGLTKCVIDWINLNGYQAERINSMGRKIDNRRTSKDVLGHTRVIGSTKWIKGNSQTGTADISATIKGRSIKIEVKCKASGDRYQSTAQKAYQKKIEQAGGIYIIAGDFEEFYYWYNHFIKNSNG